MLELQWESINNSIRESVRDVDESQKLGKCKIVPLELYRTGKNFSMYEELSLFRKRGRSHHRSVDCKDKTDVNKTYLQYCIIFNEDFSKEEILSSWKIIHEDSSVPDQLKNWRQKKRNLTSQRQRYLVTRKYRTLD